MPLGMVWKLKFNTNQKISLAGIFLLGGLVCVASLMRLLTTNDLKSQDFPCNAVTFGTQTIEPRANVQPDKAVNLYMWSQIEPAAAFICACIPTYRPLFIGLNASLCSDLSHTRSRLSSNQGKSWTGPTGRSDIKLNVHSGYSEVADPVSCNQRISEGMTCSSTEVGDLGKSTKATIIKINRVDSTLS